MLTLSRVGVYYSIASLLAALYVVTVGLAEYHAELIAFSVLPSFIVAVGVSYANSGLKQGARLSEGVAAALAAAVPLFIASSLVYIITGYGYLSLAALLYAGLVTLVASYASRLKPETRLSVALLGYSEIMGALVYVSHLGLFYRALLLLGTMVLGSIYAVTFHTYPSTFGDEMSIPWVAVTFALLTLGAAFSLGSTHVRFSWALLGASLLTYLPGFRLHRTRGYIAKAAAIKAPAAKGGMLYFIDGHLFAAAFSVAASLALIASSFTTVPVLIIVHLLAIGVIGTYIFIHSPLMLPVILRWPNARRYNLTPYLSLSLAAALWPFNMHVAFFFVGLALVFLVLIVRPSKAPYPFMLGGG